LKLHLKIKKLEAEVLSLKTHSSYFQNRLQRLEDDVRKDLKLPEIMVKMQENVFTDIRKIGDLQGLGEIA